MSFQWPIIRTPYLRDTFPVTGRRVVVMTGSSVGKTEAVTLNPNEEERVENPPPPPRTTGTNLLERIENDFKHHPPATAERAALHQDIRLACKDLAGFIARAVPPGREQSVALTKLEEVMFWANSGIARAIVFLAALLLGLLLAGPAHAWRVGVGAAGGIIEGRPATALHLDLEDPGQRLHLRPRLAAWAPEGEPGIWELGLDAFWHARPCASVSAYAGFGVGIEWLPPEPAVPVVVVCCDDDRPDPPPPPKPDPPSPIGGLAIGVRFPGDRGDVFAELRATLRDGEPRVGPFVGYTVHPRREVARRPAGHRGHR